LDTIYEKPATPLEVVEEIEMKDPIIMPSSVSMEEWFNLVLKRKA